MKTKNNKAISIGITAILAISFLATFLLVAIPSVQASPTNIEVNETGWWWEGQPETFNASDTPIQHAINNATEGDTIFVHAGLYTETVNVDKRLTLQGDGRDVVTVNATGIFDNVFDVWADRVTISGFTITGVNRESGGGCYYGVYLSHANYSEISHNIITDNCDGIHLWYSHHNTIRDNIVYDNSNEGCMSCPFVYSWDGQEYRFDADPFPGSIAKALESTYYDNLEYLTPSEGKYLLKMTEELPETSYVNELKLIAVDHPSGTQIIPDSQGNIHTLRVPCAPIACEEKDGTECLDKVKEKDEIYWTSNLGNKDFSEVEDLTDGLILTFEKPEDANIAKVAVRFKQTRLSEYVSTTLFKLMGENLDDWYDEFNSNPDEVQKLVKTFFKVYFFQLEVWNGTEWVPEGILHSHGQWIPGDAIRSIDVSGIEGETIKIKLESTTGLVLIDSVRMDYSVDEAVTPHELSATTAVDANGMDVRPEMLSNDDSYLIMEMGDRIYLSFDEISANPDCDRSYAIKVKGYYQSSIPAEGEAQEELVENILTDLSYARSYFLEGYASANGHCGIHLGESSDNTILRNEIYDNGDEEGIYLYGSDSNQIIGNNIHDNDDGIYLSSSSDNTIERNMIVNNTGGWMTGVHITDGSDYNEIHENCFIDNEPDQAVDDLENDDSNNWNRNFWDPPPGGPGNYTIPGYAGSKDNNPLSYCPGIPAKVPALTPIGMIALIGILSVVLAVATLRRKRR